MRDTGKKVRKATKIGGSVTLALTGFINPDDFYKIESSGKQVILTKIDV